MKKALWKGSFSANFVPAFPCPNCRSGILRKSGKEDLVSRRPRDPSFEEYSENPSNWPSRFALFLHCKACSEFVVVTGWSTDVAEESNDSVEWLEYLEPESMWPPPPIITVERTPKEVRAELQKSFGFYWNDAGACASRMRTSLERLMDHFKVRTITVVTDKTGKKYRKRLDLSSRIDKFAAKIRSREYSDMLHALRVVGNVGTHGTKTVTKAHLLDAYRLYEHALERMFEDKSESIKETIKRLSKLK